MSSLTNVVNNANANSNALAQEAKVQEAKVQEAKMQEAKEAKEAKSIKEIVNEDLKLYTNLGYEDPEIEYETKYGGDIIDIHTNMQIYCEDNLLGIYNKESYIDFTDFIKKYSSTYHCFVEDIVDDYRKRYPEKNICDEDNI